MRVEEIMSPATGCRQGDSVRTCAAMMRDQGIGFAPVCEAGGKPVGAITDRDLAIRVLADGLPADEPIVRFMTQDVVACHLGDDVRDAERLMRDRRKSRIMVCDEAGELKGVISLADIARVESDASLGDTLQEVKSDQPAMH